MYTAEGDKYKNFTIEYRPTHDTKWWLFTNSDKRGYKFLCFEDLTNFIYSRYFNNSESKERVSDSYMKSGDLHDVRKSECEANESDISTEESVEITLGNRIDSEKSPKQKECKVLDIRNGFNRLKYIQNVIDKGD